jgi:hypothetical protein
VRFHGTAASLKVGVDMETESRLFRIPETANDVALEGRRLSHHRDMMALLARFEAAPSP